MGSSGVSGMYICKDHKSRKPNGRPYKRRVVQGILNYTVCETARAAETTLRDNVRFTETGEVYEKMFRKERSLYPHIPLAEDKARRDRLCQEEHWTTTDFANQKQMYHFELALETSKAMVVDVTETCPSPSTSKASKPTSSRPDDSRLDPAANLVGESSKQSLEETLVLRETEPALGGSPTGKAYASPQRLEIFANSR